MNVHTKVAKVYLTELAPLLFPMGTRNGLMAILAGYFDDSGTHDSSTCVVVAGAVASVNQWNRLAQEWAQTIEPWNLLHGYFHMADFVSGQGDYEGWSETEKRQRLRQLVGVIHRHIRVLVGNAIVHADFKVAYDKCPCRDIGTAYRFCAFLALPAVDNWRRRSPRRKPVALIFESGNKLLNEYGRILAQIGDCERTREQYGISSITQGTKKDMPQLQAADLIAYAAYKSMSQNRVDDYLAESFEILFNLPIEGCLHSNPEIIEKQLRKGYLP